MSGRVCVICCSWAVLIGRGRCSREQGSEKLYRFTYACETLCYGTLWESRSGSCSNGIELSVSYLDNRRKVWYFTVSRTPIYPPKWESSSNGLWCNMYGLYTR